MLRLAVAAIVLLAIPIHWVKSDVTQILPDDVLLMTVSREIRAGAWSGLWTPQHIHLLPLYRILRLPFDRNFPSSYIGLHAVLVAAHLASAVFLFLLARRYLKNPWAAAVTAMLFAWSTVGDEALVWKAAAPFALSWPFLLGGAWLLQRGWTAAALAALLSAVGFFSGALFVLPGLLAAVLLLEPDRRRQALIACGIPWLAGTAAWLGLVVPAVSLGHYWRFADSPENPFARTALGLKDLLLAYNYQLFLGARFLSPYYTALVLLPLMALALYLFRRDLNLWLILSALALTAPLALVIMVIRREPQMWTFGRYSYQSFTFWCVLLGALLDAILARLEGRRLLTFAALLLVMAALYWSVHFKVARHDRAYFQTLPATQRAFWTSWQRFFRSATPVRLRDAEVTPHLRLRTIYRLCFPDGLPGVIIEGPPLKTSGYAPTQPAGPPRVPPQ